MSAAGAPGRVLLAIVRRPTAGTIELVRLRHLVLVAATVALVLAALVLGGGARPRAAGDAVSDGPCHAQVNCVGQIANAPLGSSMLPVTTVVVVAALVLLARLDLTPSSWHDRLAGGRLFRPPRLAS
jgi:hypothetical protein